MVEYILDGHHYPLRCQAEVVRVQPSGGGFTIGARLVAQQPLQEVAIGAPPKAAPPLRRVA